MRYVAGELLQFLERARSIASSPAFDADYPKTRLYDGWADAAAWLASNAASPTITIDLAMLGADAIDNAALDAWQAGLPVGWAVTATGGGAVTETTTAGEIRSGSAAKLKKGTGTARVAKTYRVRAGQRLNLSAWVRVAASGVAGVAIYNPVTKHYYSPAGGGSWTSALTYAAASTSLTYVEATGTFTVEGLAACGDPITYVQLLVEDFGAGGASDYAFVDDAFVWPSWNAVIVSGHNIEPGMAPTVRSSTDNFASVDTSEAAIAIQHPTCYAYLSTPSTRRYVRLAMTGAQSPAAGAVFIGELVVTYLETAARSSRTEDGYETELVPDNLELQAAPRRASARMALQRRRRLRLAFLQPTDAQYVVARDEVHGRCHGTLWPLVIVPRDADDVVVHGRLDEDAWKARRLHDGEAGGIYEDGLTIIESPPPRVVPG